jgi:hypothetical protein
MSRASFNGWFLDRPHMAGFEVATHGRFWVATEASFADPQEKGD